MHILGADLGTLFKHAYARAPAEQQQAAQADTPRFDRSYHPGTG